MKKYIFLIFSVIFIVFSSCEKNNNAVLLTDGSKNPPIETTEYSDTFYSVSKDLKTLTVKFEANYTTGFSWNWFEEDSKEDLFEFSEYYTVLNSDENLVGQGGEWTGTFKVKSDSPITATIKFMYKRKWETSGTDKSFDHLITLSSDSSGCISVINAY